MCYEDFCCGDPDDGCESLVASYGAYVMGWMGGGLRPYNTIHPDTQAIPGPIEERPHITVPRHIANGMATACQEAVRWFHEKDHTFLGDPTVRNIPDDEVRERIEGYQSELDSEWRRVRQIPTSDSRATTPTGQAILKYELSEMPFARQRALVERWEKIWIDWLEAHPGWTVTNAGFIPPTGVKGKDENDG